MTAEQPPLPGRGTYTERAEAKARELKLTLIRDDKMHKPGKETYVVWVCNKHGVAPPLNPSEQPYISNITNAPAYRTRGKLFVQKQTCCGIGLNESRKASGFNTAQAVLLDRGKKFNTTYSFPDIKSPADWQGKRVQRRKKGEEGKIKVHCSLHDTTTSIKFESLARHVSIPCSVCREASNNKGKIQKVIENRKLHSGPAHRKWRTGAMKVHGNRCLLTGVEYKPGFAGIEAHHINAKEDYPHLAKNYELNSIMLMGSVHKFFHYAFLGYCDNDYDPYMASLDFGKQANLWTFLLFLHQLLRDLVNEVKNGVASRLQEVISTQWKEDKQKGILLSESPPLLSVENILDLIQELDTAERFALVEKSPVFEQWCQATNFTFKRSKSDSIAFPELID